MIQRFNILVQFTIITLLATIALSVGFSYYLEKLTGRQLIRNHVEIFPGVVNTLVTDHPEFFELLQAPPGTQPGSGAKRYLGELKNFGKVFRVKVWNRDGIIVWSDVDNLVGKSFADNPHFQQAMNGVANYEVTRPEKAEHIHETSLDRILEIYTPVVRNGEIIGVVELYETGNDLFVDIEQAKMQLRLAVLTGGGLLYLLLFFIYLAAHQRHEKAVRNLLKAHDATIFSLAYQAELRDIETGQHLERTSRYILLLAEELRRQKKHLKTLNRTYINELVKSSPLHDIGKSGVSDAILYKPHKLTDAEFDAMKKHCEYGARIIGKAEERLPESNFLQVAREIILYHHEHWDGNGYPEGLRGEEIPLSARLMALADVYDALRSVRYYKDAIPHEECVAIIREKSGSHFDPDVVDAFLKNEKTFLNISEQYADPSEEIKKLA